MTALFLTAACSPASRPAGAPFAHYPSGELNLSSNHVHETTRALLVRFLPGTSKIVGGASDPLMLPDGVHHAIIYSPPYDSQQPSRELALKRWLRGQGLRSDQIGFGRREGDQGEYVIEFEMAYAVPTACPDWSQSAAHNYANELFTNHGCATAANLGQQIADPREIERGTGNPRPDLQRNGAVLSVYSSNKLPWPSAKLAREGFPIDASPIGAAASSSGSGDTAAGGLAAAVSGGAPQ